jgi:hypothetical protein
MEKKQDCREKAEVLRIRTVREILGARQPAENRMMTFQK